jgi:hypothetical protein
MTISTGKNDSTEFEIKFKKQLEQCKNLLSAEEKEFLSEMILIYIRGIKARHSREKKVK